MHQGHAIPWTIISNNFKHVRQDTRYTPPFTGIILSGDPKKAEKELKHFIRKFVSVITTFSKTKRKKYPSHFPIPTTRKVFSDDMLRRYPEFLNEENQDMDYWISRAKKRNSENEEKITYDSSDGKLADVIKILLNENAMDTLLMLAHHPEMPIAKLFHIHWGHHFGFSRVMESSLRAYLFFNTAEAVGVLGNGVFSNLENEGESFLWEMAASMDYPAQQIPHCRFLADCGLLPFDGSWDGKTANLTIPHDRLHGYLKDNFARLYRYDVLMRECRLDPQWEKEIVNTFPFLNNVHMEWDESLEDYILGK